MKTITLRENETLRYGGLCVTGPGDFDVPDSVACGCADKILVKKPVSKCFPDACGRDGYYPDSYRDGYLVPAGTTIEATVPSIEGCSGPIKAYFQYCGGCLFVDYDRVPAITNSEGMAAEINPTERLLTKYGGGMVNTIYITNATAEDAYIVIVYE